MGLGGTQVNNHLRREDLRNVALIAEERLTDKVKFRLSLFLLIVYVMFADTPPSLRPSLVCSQRPTAVVVSGSLKDASNDANNSVNQNIAGKCKITKLSVGFIILD